MVGDALPVLGYSTYHQRIITVTIAAAAATTTTLLSFKPESEIITNWLTFATLENKRNTYTKQKGENNKLYRTHIMHDKKTMYSTCETVSQSFNAAL